MRIRDAAVLGGYVDGLRAMLADVADYEGEDGYPDAAALAYGTLAGERADVICGLIGDACDARARLMALDEALDALAGAIEGR